ncbi:IS200/IS605 family transposase [Alkalibacterium sp.]|uniref:IS200/IS605 family transposase n=1 Tax=Alkalibacterium sp. TaxID=1872447 RepID=UPI003970B425
MKLKKLFKLLIKADGGIQMYTKTRTNVYRTTYHLVWVTKYRKAIFTTPERRQAMTAFLHAIAENNDIAILESEVVDDHVHLVVSFPPNKSISSVMKALKGASARDWFKQFPDTKKELWKGSLWSHSYFVSTVGDVSKEVVMQYVQNQLKEFNSGRSRRDSSPG